MTYYKHVISVFLSFFFLNNSSVHGKIFAPFMVTGVNGDVNIESEGEKHPVQLFEKILPGKKIIISENSRVRLLFLEYNRIDDWIGPREIEYNDKNESLSGMPMRSISIKENIKLIDSPILNEQKNIVSGVIVIRGAKHDKALNDEEKLELSNYKQNYKTGAKKAFNGDATDTILLIAKLDILGQKKTVDKILNEILIEYINNTEIKKMIERIR